MALDSADLRVPNAQHAPLFPWSLMEVITPESRRSYEAGRLLSPFKADRIGAVSLKLWRTSDAKSVEDPCVSESDCSTVWFCVSRSDCVEVVFFVRDTSCSFWSINRKWRSLLFGFVIVCVITRLVQSVCTFSFAIVGRGDIESTKEISTNKHMLWRQRTFFLWICIYFNVMFHTFLIMGSYRCLPDKADRCSLQARYRAICIDTYYIIMMQSHLYWYLHHYDTELSALVLTSLWYRAICISTYIIMIQYYLLLPCASYYRKYWARLQLLNGVAKFINF